MGTPVLSLFGGTDPKRHSPLRLPSAVLYLGPEPPRRTVDRRDGAAHLALITPQMAYDAAIALIKGRQAP
jgi:ADP-heptose:LPS heptosyltransferase